MREILAARLRECRRRKGVTQWEAAVGCDITEAAYQNYENMTRLPRADILARIADYYNTSTDYLLGRKDDPTP